MAGVVLSGNTTIKVNGAVSASSSGAGTTLYTCTTNAYAILNLGFTSLSGWVGTVSVDSKVVFEIGSGVSGGIPGNVTSGGSAYSFSQLTLYVGASQAVSFSRSSGTGTVTVTGVEFNNTP